MCLLTFAWEMHEQWRLVLVVNRDEFHQRPSRSADFWEDAPCVYAGRDLKAGGSWMGLNLHGCWAGVTNYREPQRPSPAAPSRGRLVTEYLTGGYFGAESYTKHLRHALPLYPAVNMVYGDSSGVWYAGNRADDRPRRLGSGIYGLSNHLLDTPWPKVLAARRFMGQWLKQSSDPAVLMDQMHDQTFAPDFLLPTTGVGVELERFLSPVFVRSPAYGTRSTTLLMLDRDGNAQFMERCYNEQGSMVETRDRFLTLGD